MSKIILTEEQGNRLNLAGLRNNGTLPSWYAHVLNEAIAMGLVRPAHDDLAARVAALEAYINGDEPGVPPNVRTPDPHAAAKDDYPADVLKACPRAREWGVVVYEAGDGRWEWRTSSMSHWWRSHKKRWDDFSEGWSYETGSCNTREDAMSNPPTVPPPALEAKVDSISGITTTTYTMPPITTMQDVAGRNFKCAIEHTPVGTNLSIDPHAAEKERAKLWGVELVSEPSGVIFRAKTGFWCVRVGRWLNIIAGPSPVSSACCYCRTPDEAWSNFPTVPPPGWEESQSKAIPPKLPEPRTEADRLGEAVWNALKSPYSKSWSELVEHVKDSYCEAAIAVRKADRAAQLEPSEEEVKAALLCWRETLSTVAEMKDILAAAARVRLEKAEGEKP